MLSKLKMELGINAVNKMSQMFKDMNLSKTMHLEFTANKANASTNVELNSVQVLTNGNWPIDELPPCEIPRELVDVQSKFKRFYNNKFNNRKLKWLN